MPRADYYILAESDHDSRELFACRLCEKAYAQGLKILIYLQNDADLKQFDQRLWSFRPDSFIPHAILNDSNHAPVTLTSDASAHFTADVLINLGAEPPPCAEAFERVVEIVTQDPTVLSATRQSFKDRRASGWEVHRHDQRQ